MRALQYKNQFPKPSRLKPNMANQNKLTQNELTQNKLSQKELSAINPPQKKLMKPLKQNSLQACALQVIKSKQDGLNATNTWVGLSRDACLAQYYAILKQQKLHIYVCGLKNYASISFAKYEYLPYLGLLLSFRHQVCIQVNVLVV